MGLLQEGAYMSVELAKWVQDMWGRQAGRQARKIMGRLKSTGTS